MPPPTITTSVPGALICDSNSYDSEPQRSFRTHRRSGKIFEQPDERRRGIQRSRSPNRRPAYAAGCHRLNVDVEQDLGMVADEADRHDEPPAPSVAGPRAHDFVNIRTDPRLRRPTCTLVCHEKVRDAN